jgi:hypothetical protein
MIYCELLLLLMALCSLISVILVGWWIVLFENKWHKLLAFIACIGVLFSGYFRFINQWQMVWEGNKTRSQYSVITEPGDYFFYLLWQDEESLVYLIYRSTFFILGLLSVLIVFILLIGISYKFTKCQTRSIK